MLDFNTALPERSEENVGTANIKVVGVGGGGQNAVNRMYRERVPEVEYISVNTDAQALDSSVVPVRLRVGDNTARGLGVGGDPSKGRQCLEEDRDEIVEILKAEGIEIARRTVAKYRESMHIQSSVQRRRDKSPPS